MNNFNISSIEKSLSNLKHTPFDYCIIDNFFTSKIANQLLKNELEKILIPIHPYEIPFIKEIITGKTNEDYLKWVMKNL